MTFNPGGYPTISFDGLGTGAPTGSTPNLEIPSAPAGTAGTATSLSLSSQDASNNFNQLLNDLENKANKGDTSALEQLFNYFATEQSNKTARDWTAVREDNQYQRLVADLKKAGISPYILSSATPAVSSPIGSSHSGSQMTSKRNSELNYDKASSDRAVDISRSVLSLVGTALMALAILG